MDGVHECSVSLNSDKLRTNELGVFSQQSHEGKLFHTGNIQLRDSNKVQIWATPVSHQKLPPSYVFVYISINCE